MNFANLVFQMQEQLAYHQQPADTQKTALDPQLFITLIGFLRPQNVHDQQEIQQKIDQFIAMIVATPTAQFTIQQYLFSLMRQYKQSQLYADMGIFSFDGFLNQLGQRIASKFLPIIPDQKQLNFLVEQLFPYESDSEWLEKISDEQWTRLLILFDHPREQLSHHTQGELLHAITILSYRLSGLGLYREFTHALPELEEYESPFLVQNREIMLFIDQYKKFTHTDEVTVLPVPDASQALVMLEQCNEMVLKVRRATKRIGVSFGLTYLLTFMEQCLERTSILLRILSEAKPQRYVSLGKFIHSLSYAHHEEKSVRALLASNSELIALQVTENASRTGENYVSTDRAGLFKMYKKAAGAGLIIAFMATLKTLSARMAMAPIMQAFVYSMNYGLGFVFIHMLHFTVATKQPAATAAALAATVQQRKGSKTAQLAELSTLIINIIRTQFVAILGNISIAIPVAAAIAFAWDFILNEPLLSHAKAAKSLHDLNPFTSLAIPHAAIAGVCLFFSGLIAGYFDNLAIYRKIGPRIEAHQRLLKWFGDAKVKKIATYVDDNLGALMGNFLFGVMLGSMGTIGMILGLPLDIRHIAFASANFIQGLMTINGGPDIALVIVSFLGVLLIGLTNLFVSFTLTIIVALRARRVRFEQWKPLAKLVLTHFFTRPSDFFWPPAKQKDETEDVK